MLCVLSRNNFTKLFNTSWEEINQKKDPGDHLSAGEGETSGRERGIYESPAEWRGVFFSGGCWVSEGEGLSSTGTGKPGPHPSPPKPGGSI